MSRYISPVLYVLLMLVGCLAFISIAGVRIGVFEPLTGFALLKKSVFASLVLSVLAAASLYLCRKDANASTSRFFTLVLILTFLYSSMWILYYVQRSGLPKITDVTTDTQVPPRFLNINFLRHSGDNSLRYNQDWAPIQKEYYPDVKPLFTNKPKSVVYHQALQQVADNNWQLVASYPDVGVIEATARTPVFGFRDDVVIRITRENGQVRVDMRSCSRVGSVDYGVNAKRIVRYMDDLSDDLSDKPMRKMRYLN